METYVHSCGISQEDGYCWLQITQDIQQRVDEPELVKNFKHLLQCEAPSVLLLRLLPEKNKLLLLVTGLKASKRTDYQGRIIQNSIAWLCENSDENEKQLRALAVHALMSFIEEDLLTKEIDNAVKSSNEEGFKVDNFEDIKAEKLSKNIIIGNSNLDSLDSNTKKIGNSDKLAYKLAKELEEYCLPKQKDSSEPLIVVFTGIKAPSALEQAGVWRGVSSLVQGEEWKDYKQSQTDQKKKTFILLVIFIILCLLLSQSQPTPNQETQSLPQPPSLSTQPASSPSPPSQLLENNLNPTSILLKIQAPSIELVKQTKTSKSQDQETINTSSSASQPEATRDSIYRQFVLNQEEN